MIFTSIFYGTLNTRYIIYVRSATAVYLLPRQVRILPVYIGLYQGMGLHSAVINPLRADFIVN